MDCLCWVITVACAALVMISLRLAPLVWWKPLQMKKYFGNEGIRGPPYKVIYGNTRDIAAMIDEASSAPMPLSHHILPRVLPYYHRWTKTYGRDFLFWFGCNARLALPDPELIKEILLNKFGNYEKLDSDPLSRQLAAQGLVGLKGEKWVKHRRIISPAFHTELLKGMIPTIVESGANMLEEWSKLSTKEIEVQKEFRTFTAEVIARTAFGSSYIEGKQIFNMQGQQMVLAAELFRSVYFPGYRFLPTKKNRQRWKLEKDIRMSIRQLIEARERAVSTDNSGSYGTDLLGLMMTGNKKQVGANQENGCMTMDEIIDECKTFYFAGHETTSNLLTWTMIILGMHQDWQERGRREVLEVCGRDVYPDADTVNRLKIVGMIINEVLRLYPPAVMLARQTNKAVKLGRFNIPAKTQIVLPILAIHHDPALWGDDVHVFNPQRFAEGIAKAAKHPAAFMPFGLGPTICVGQNFALLEAKVVLAMILQRFSFAISPSYAHAPIFVVTMQPQYGAQIILQEN